MTAKAKKIKAAGGRLNRSETVSVRLDPKLNYLCELAARAQRRSKSSFIEWAIENALGSVPVAGTGDFLIENHTIAELAQELWDTDEPDRVAMLAFKASALMTHEEQVIWKLIRESGLMWRGYYSEEHPHEWIWKVTPETLDRQQLRDNWEAFKAVAEGAADASLLPVWAKYDPAHCPF